MIAANELYLITKINTPDITIAEEENGCTGLEAILDVEEEKSKMCELPFYSE